MNRTMSGTTMDVTASRMMTPAKRIYRLP